MNQLEIQSFVSTLLECSLYLSPNEPGLTYDEVIEAASRINLQIGEIGDALQQIEPVYFGRSPTRLLPGHRTKILLGVYGINQEPEFRNFDALEFIFSAFNDRIRTVGIRNAKIERFSIVERAVLENVPRIDMEAAITIMIFCEQLTEDNGVLSLKQGMEQRSPIREREQVPINRQDYTSSRASMRKSAFSIVKDIIERRSDGRQSHADPFDAFSDSLELLGYSSFRLWWGQTCAEFKRSDAQISPISTLILAAALVEGVLTFVVKHARSQNLGVFASNDFVGEPRTWKIDNLVESAARGGEAAILDNGARLRVQDLIKNRQRIHAGRMLSEFPNGNVPDLKPEQAKQAGEIAALVIRKVLEWLQKHPPK